MKIHLGIAWESATMVLCTKRPHILCAGIAPLQIGVALVFISLIIRIGG